MLDPRPLSGTAGNQAAPGLQAAASFRKPQSTPVVTLAAVEPAAVSRVVESPAEPVATRMAAAPPAREMRIVPLPVPRPAELTAAAPERTEPPRLAQRQTPRRVRTAALPANVAEPPSFFEELFSGRKSPEKALGYAAVDPAPAEAPRRNRLFSTPAPDAGEGVAVYDISASTVRLPSGEVLEAHSGLGPHKDDPRFVHLRMRGSTPPGTYEVTERERLFHGVRALRLTPVGGSAAIHGRDGILAHTYMLGAGGDSNGCVSFRDYNRFLQAYLRGEIRRLVVVAGSGYDGPPSRVGALRRTGGSRRDG